MFKRVISLIYFVCFINLMLLGQSLVYQKRFKTGTYVNGGEICSTSDTGNLVVTMPATSAFGPQAFNLTKFDKVGNILWSKLYASGTGIFHWVHSPIRTSDNNYFFTGQCNFGSGYGDMMALKIDSLGNITWSKVIGTATNEYGTHAIEFPDNSLGIMGGSDINGDNRDFFFAKLDSTGNFIFSKRYGNDTDHDNGSSIALASDGGCVLGGHKRVNDTLPSDYYLVRLDSSGNVLWSYTYGGTNQDDFQNVLHTMDNGYLMIGVTASFSANWAGLIVKVDSTGNIIWSKTYDKIIGFGNAIELNDGSIVIGGGGGLIKLDHSGNWVWYKKNGGGFGCINPNGDFTGLAGIDSVLIIIRTDSAGNTCTQSQLPLIISDVVLQRTNVITSSGDLGTALNYPIAKINYVPYNAFLCNMIPVNANENNYTAIYPNPSNGFFTISLNKIIKEGEVSIFNVMGEKVYEDAFAGREKTIEPNLTPGLYFLRVSNEVKSFFSKSLVISH